MPIPLYPMLSFSIISHRASLNRHPYPYFVCMVVFLTLSGILYMVSEQLNFSSMGLSALCPTPSYPGGPMFSVGVVSLS